MAVNVLPHMPNGYEGTEGGRFNVQVQASTGIDLWFRGDYDHNGVRVEGPIGMNHTVNESMRGWGDGIAPSAAKLARTAYGAWLAQFDAAPIEAEEK